ncbi:hypothetical protein CDD80_1249 [Ophiocordyceps camponoti-rufipedis]|uniref:Homeobox domain-containing protein n=1 Tax=Ophiocordyceps camponoti-rufipedis TaxID=2004952 RepID=A0A2C5Y3H3_9HYPO|nr:hypothetical protein CDD80_1249 [Ophiocordyceps camponoti-rufipedis]
MHTPPPHSVFRSPGHWDAQPSPDLTRPRTENQTVALPPIRQTFPDLRLDEPLGDYRHLAFRSPSTAGLGSLASPEYVHSPNACKRRRVSLDDELPAFRTQHVPRLYSSPERPYPRQLASPRREPPMSAATTGTWASPTRSSPLASGGGPIEIGGRIEPLHMMPGVVKLEYPPMLTPDGREPGGPPDSAGPIPYRAHDYGYGYHHHHANRPPSLSAGAVRPHERPPLTAGPLTAGPLTAPGGPYHPHFSDMGRPGDLGGDAKQRKRRGNLPKETTDKLRAWFVAHLHHPYPTEEEKQDLMRQTGLQMNQISNWFINARRRQLPAMMNNVRAESEVMSGRGGVVGGEGDGMLASTEREYGTKGLPLSDGEGCAYDEDMRGLRKRRAGELSRESV